jgi:hypothetical protein
MSDPVTNVEIEDVLSSIRRLVSESGGTKTEVQKASPAAERLAYSSAKVAPAAKPASASEAESLDKLVLTPALRVVDAPDQKTEQAAPQDVEFRHDTTGDSEVRQDAETAESPAEEQGAQAEEANAEDALTEDTISFEETASASGEAAPEGAAAATDAGESLKDRIQQLEAAVSTQEGEWEEEETGEALAWEDHSTEPDVAPEPFVTSDTHRAEAPAEDAEYTEEDESEDGFNFMAGDETLLDEDALREMVADIVRQELQGALGERITRNVRKLVRREIQRALMAQEFE